MRFGLPGPLITPINRFDIIIIAIGERATETEETPFIPTKNNSYKLFRLLLRTRHSLHSHTVFFEYRTAPVLLMMMMLLLQLILLLFSVEIGVFTDVATTTQTTATAGFCCCHFCLWHCWCTHFSLFAKCEWLSICPPRFFFALRYRNARRYVQFSKLAIKRITMFHSVEHLFLVMDVAVVRSKELFLPLWIFFCDLILFICTVH